VQDFIHHLETDVIAAPVQIISKEQALDLQISQDPSLMSVLSGENPLPDVLMIPLYHTDIELFWSSMDKHRQLFENPSSVEDIRKHLTGIQQTLKQIQTATYLVGVFLALTAIVMLLLLVFTIRSHLRRFHEEYTIGRLVGAEPYFFWTPHILSMTGYLIISLVSSGAIFLLVRSFF
jgi:cell division protein FtsX